MSALLSEQLQPRNRLEPQNQVLTALLLQVGDVLRRHLKPTFLTRREVLVDADERLTRIYFPQNCTVVSMMCLFDDGRVAEMAIVGSEGVVPVGGPLGAETSFARCTVHIPGPAMAVDAARLQSVALEHPAVGKVLAASIAMLLSQVLQSAACNAVHTAEQRCARWLLTAMDRSGSDCLPLTQELMAEMLGVHRPTVSIVARSLQQAGMIRYSRGAITIVDRQGLEQAACECYGLARQKLERLSRRLVA